MSNNKSNTELTVYRTYSIIPSSKEEDIKLIWENVFSYNNIYSCPICSANNKYNTHGDLTCERFYGCLGKKKFWSSKFKCPPKPHLHINCWACKFKFLMWST